MIPSRDFSILENVDFNESKYEYDFENSFIESILVKNNGEHVKLKNDYYF